MTMHFSLHKSWRGDPVRASLLSGLLVCSALVSAQGQQAAPVQPTQPPRNALEQLTAQAGIGTCMGVVHRVAPAMTGPAGTFAAMLMTNPVAPDAAAFAVSVERAEPTGPRLVSAVFAPTGRGGCDVGYDMIDVWAKPCPQVAVEDLGYTKPLNVIGKSIGVIPISPTHHIYLMPTAGNGCVSITKELLFP
jgi:hypothetical protein